MGFLFVLIVVCCFSFLLLFVVVVAAHIVCPLRKSGWQWISTLASVMPLSAPWLGGKEPTGGKCADEDELCVFFVFFGCLFDVFVFFWCGFWDVFVFLKIFLDLFGAVLGCVWWFLDLFGAVLGCVWFLDVSFGCFRRFDWFVVVLVFLGG